MHSADFNSKMEDDGVRGFADAQRRLAMEVPNVGNNENARLFLQAASAGNISMVNFLNVLVKEIVFL